MIAAHPPIVGISPRCMLTAVPLSAALWAIIIANLAPAPATSRERSIHTCTSHATLWAQADCWTTGKYARHG